MTFYFAAGEMGGFFPSDSTSTEVVSPVATTTYNQAFARNSIVCGAGAPTQYAETAAVALPDDFYVHCDVMRGTIGTNTATALSLAAAGTDVFRVRSTNSTLQMQALIGAVWTNVGSAVTWDGTALQTLDLSIEGNSATGTAKLYLSGTLRETASSVDLSSVASITSARSYGVDTASEHHLSQMIIADEPTIGMRLATYYPAGAGATANWTGDYTGVDEAVLSDADFIYSATNGQIELFTASGPSLTGYVVRAVGVYARARKGASGPANLQLALRVNGTDYFSASKALDVGFSAYGNVWATNPDTTTDWLVAQIAALQFGVKAIT